MGISVVKDRHRGEDRRISVARNEGELAVYLLAGQGVGCYGITSVRILKAYGKQITFVSTLGVKGNVKADRINVCKRRYLIYGDRQI